MKKIILYGFTIILLISSSTFCMFFNATRFSRAQHPQQGKRFFCEKQVLSLQDCAKFYKLIKENKKKIRELKQQSTPNIRAIWRLEDQTKQYSSAIRRHNVLEQRRDIERAEQ